MQPKENVELDGNQPLEPRLICARGYELAIRG
jgi:hypothetical protein